jgi:hypothetical protein
VKVLAASRVTFPFASRWSGGIIDGGSDVQTSLSNATRPMDEQHLNVILAGNKKIGIKVDVRMFMNPETPGTLRFPE